MRPWLLLAAACAGTGALTGCAARRIDAGTLAAFVPHLTLRDREPQRVDPHPGLALQSCMSFRIRGRLRAAQDHVEIGPGIALDCEAVGSEVTLTATRDLGVDRGGPGSEDRLVLCRLGSLELPVLVSVVR